MTHRNRGFSLPEVMVVVAILSVLSGVVIDAGIRDWRREQVNAVVVELAGWLESVRRAALKGSSCQVTLNFDENNSSLTQVFTAGEVLASGSDVGVVDPEESTLPEGSLEQLQIANNCRSSQPLVIPSLSTVQRFEVVATAVSFVFTPAGTLYPAPQPSAPIVIQVSLADGQDPQRCVQLEGLLGVIHVGRLNDGHCDTASDRI